jgi:hypothetical protein
LWKVRLLKIFMLRLRSLPITTVEQKWDEGVQFWKFSDFQTNLKLSHLSRRCPHREEEERRGELKIVTPSLCK